MKEKGRRKGMRAEATPPLASTDQEAGILSYFRSRSHSSPFSPHTANVDFVSKRINLPGFLHNSTMLRVLLRSYGEVAARSSATEASLPQLATSFESLRRFSGYDEGSKTGKGEYGDGEIRSHTLTMFVVCYI